MIYALMLKLYPHREEAGKRDWQAFCRFDIHTDGDLYLRRFILAKTPWGGLYLHHILRSDIDRCPHDHPWAFGSLILAGGYHEETFVRTEVQWRGQGPDRQQVSCPQSDERAQRWYGPGSFRWVPAHHTHRVLLPEGRPAWSLVVIGARVRSWGFWQKGAWVPWKTFVGGERDC